MYPNAYNGIKKIFTAEVLSLISALIGVFAAIVAVVGLQHVDAGAEDIGSASAFVGGGLVLIISGIVAIVAFILKIVGVSNAAVDEPNFKKASSWILAGIVCSIATSMTTDGTLLHLAASVLYTVCQLYVTMYVIDGVCSLAEKIGRTDFAQKGAKLKNIIIGIYVISLVLTVISKFVSGSDTMTVIAGVLAVIALIAMVIAYFMYLNLLSRAKQMLA